MEKNIFEQLKKLRKIIFDKKEKPMIYLAGSMEFAKKGYGKGWRDEIEEVLKDDYLLFNPTEEVKLFKELKEIKESTENGFDLDRLKKQFDGIVKHDIYKVLESDLVLCYWENEIPTNGTPSELTFAKIFGIPVLIINKDIENMSKWVLGCMTDYMTSFDNVKEKIKHMLENK